MNILLSVIQNVEIGGIMLDFGFKVPMALVVALIIFAWFSFLTSVFLN